MGRLRIFVVLAVVAGLVGCMQIKEELVIEKDGSGTYSGSFTFGEQMTAMMAMAEGFAKQAGAGAGVDNANSDFFTSVEQVEKAFEGEGFTVEEAKAETIEGKMSVRFKVAFDDVNKLLESDAFGKRKITLYQKDGQLVFAAKQGKNDVMGGPMSFGPGGDEQPSGDGADDASQAPPMDEMAKMMQKQMLEAMKDLSVEFTIVMPNEIASSNSKEVNDRKAYWKFGVEDIRKSMDGMNVSEAAFDPTASCSMKGIAFEVSPMKDSE